MEELRYLIIVLPCICILKYFIVNLIQQETKQFLSHLPLLISHVNKSVKVFLFCIPKIILQILKTNKTFQDYLLHAKITLQFLRKLLENHKYVFLYFKQKREMLEIIRFVSEDSTLQWRSFYLFQERREIFANPFPLWSCCFRGLGMKQTILFANLPPLSLFRDGYSKGMFFEQLYDSRYILHFDATHTLINAHS